MAQAKKTFTELLDIRPPQPPEPDMQPATASFRKKLRKQSPAMEIRKKLRFRPVDMEVLDQPWVPEKDLPVARDCFGLTVANGRVYAIGGRAAIGEDSLFQTEASLVHAYDPATQTWSTRKGMLYPHAGNAAVTAANGRIYSFGGYIKMTMENYDDPLYKVLAAAGSTSNLVQEYDPSANVWSLKNNMPRERAFHAAVAATDGAVYVFGGYGIDHSWPDPTNPDPEMDIKLGDVDRYTVSSDTWTMMAPMPTPRSGLAAAQGKDGKIYVMGGLGETCEWLPTVEAYDPATNSWEKKADMPTARGAFSAVTDNEGNIHVIGGVCEWDSINTVDIYSPQSDSWQSGSPISIPRLSHGAVVMQQTLYVMGGSKHDHAADIRELLSSVISSAV